MKIYSLYPITTKVTTVIFWVMFKTLCSNWWSTQTTGGKRVVSAESKSFLWKTNSNIHSKHHQILHGTAKEYEIIQLWRKIYALLRQENPCAVGLLIYEKFSRYNFFSGYISQNCISNILFPIEWHSTRCHNVINSLITLKVFNYPWINDTPCRFL